MRSAILASLCLTSLVVAQDVADDATVRMTRRLGEVEGHIAELRSIVQRQAAGEDVSGLRWLQVSDVDRARADAVGPTAAVGAQEQTGLLRDELARLESALSVERERAETRALGDSLPRPEELARLARRARGEEADPVPRDATRKVSSRDALAPLPSRGGTGAGVEASIIHGTVDRARVGAVLLEAGIELLDAARTLDDEGRGDTANATRARARERLEGARNELEPLARSADAPLAVVFALARCEEKLGRLAVADALYAAIIERDRQPGRPGRDADLGPFGRSARTARAVMNWVRDTSDWRPRRDVDQIRWDGR